MTSDVTDFAALEPSDHTGVVLLYDDPLPAHEVAAGLLAMVDAYPTGDAFGGTEILDDWV